MNSASESSGASSGKSNLHSVPLIEQLCRNNFSFFLKVSLSESLLCLAGLESLNEKVQVVNLPGSEQSAVHRLGSRPVCIVHKDTERSLFCLFFLYPDSHLLLTLKSNQKAANLKSVH